MKKVRIGSGAGYGGDRIEPALELMKKGDLDYLIFETLAERTVALAQKEKLIQPEKGYNPLLEYRFSKIFAIYKEHPVKIITNMGAANPIAAANKIRELAVEAGLSQLKIIAVTGDDIADQLPKYYATPTLETDRKLQEFSDVIISANAYIGCEGIVAALKQGADIIVTGRVSDPSLVVGPLVYEYNKPMHAYEFLGRATIAGHLLECAGQICGGYFADPGYKEVPDLWNLGFPIAEFDELGDIYITKVDGSGGIVSAQTVKEQLLYEIQNPAAYYTPDVVADISQATVEEIRSNCVKVSNVTGHQKTGTIKVTVGYREGYLVESQISYGGHNAVARAELAREIIEKRLALLGYEYEDIRFDILGLNSLYGSEISGGIVSSFGGIREAHLRIAARTKNYQRAHRLGEEVEALYTNGPAAGGGVRNHVTDLISVISILVPENIIKQQLH